MSALDLQLIPVLTGGVETINLTARIAVLPERPSRSADLPLHGAGAEVSGEWAASGG